jgi:Predicted transcriptional regulators
MQHKSFTTLQCPIARSLERVGERWSILILRDAFHGLTRFDQFQNEPRYRPQHPGPAAEIPGRGGDAGAPAL